MELNATKKTVRKLVSDVKKRLPASAEACTRSRELSMCMSLHMGQGVLGNVASLPPVAADLQPAARKAGITGHMRDQLGKSA